MSSLVTFAPSPLAMRDAGSKRTGPSSGQWTIPARTGTETSIHSPVIAILRSVLRGRLDPATLRARLGRRARRGRDTQHPHRLEAEAKLLPPLARADVMARQLLDPFQPVADRVPVGEQARGRLRHVAVVVQIGLHGFLELGLVLLVVGGERGERLLVEALQLSRVIAHRRQ